MFWGDFHILIVPRDATKTKRVRVSRALFGVAAFFVLAVVGFFGLSLFSIVHYQNKFLLAERRQLEERQIVEQKDALIARLFSLEQLLSQSESSLSRLEKTLDLELGPVKGGVGPLELNETRLKKWNGLHEDRAALEVLEAGDVVSSRDVRGKINEVSNRIHNFDSKLEEVTALHSDKIRFLSSMPNRIPVPGWVTSGFGYRRSPTNGEYRMHYGLDIASPFGSPIKAPAAGRVIFAETSAGYGQKIILDHGYGVTTLYAHASQLFVKEGELVRKGQQIASVGNSGSSTGPHLHYEVHIDGIPADPLTYIP